MKQNYQLFENVKRLKCVYAEPKRLLLVLCPVDRFKATPLAVPPHLPASMSNYPSAVIQPSPAYPLFYDTLRLTELFAITIGESFV